MINVSICLQMLLNSKQYISSPQKASTYNWHCWLESADLTKVTLLSNLKTIGREMSNPPFHSCTCCDCEQANTALPQEATTMTLCQRHNLPPATSLITVHSLTATWMREGLEIKSQHSAVSAVLSIFPNFKERVAISYTLNGQKISPTPLPLVVLDCAVEDNILQHQRWVTVWAESNFGSADSETSAAHPGGNIHAW